MNTTMLSEQQAASMLSALGNPTRLRLFRLLVRAGHPGMIVSEIQSTLQVPPSTLSHHLSALVQARLVIQHKRGREVVSVAAYRSMDELVRFLTEACCKGFGPE